MSSYLSCNPSSSTVDGSAAALRLMTGGADKFLIQHQNQMSPAAAAGVDELSSKFGCYSAAAAVAAAAAAYQSPISSPYSWPTAPDVASFQLQQQQAAAAAAGQSPYGAWARPDVYADYVYEPSSIGGYDSSKFWSAAAAAASGPAGIVGGSMLSNGSVNNSSFLQLPSRLAGLNSV